MADRWHGRTLKTPGEVRTALVYVLANFRKHSRAPRPAGLDPFSSGEWFDGWHQWTPGSERAPPWAEWAGWRRVARENDAASNLVTKDESIARVVSNAETWLARVGWRRRGLVGLGEAPVRDP